VKPAGLNPHESANPKSLRARLAGGDRLAGACSACSACSATIASFVDREILRLPERLRSFGLLDFGLLRPLEPCFLLSVTPALQGQTKPISLILESRKAPQLSFCAQALERTNKGNQTRAPAVAELPAAANTRCVDT
jgi:hypothetical protein